MSVMKLTSRVICHFLWRFLNLSVGDAVKIALRHFEAFT